MIKFNKRQSKLLGSYIDPEKAEQLKRSKTEIEDKVTKVLTVIKNEHQEKAEGNLEDSKRVSELLELIEDFHKHYQSLYAVYDHLRGQPRRNSFRIRKEKEGSNSSSDSEYYSPEELDNRNESIQQELGTANLQVADLKQELASVSEEKESLNMEYMAAQSKIQEAEIVNKELRIEADEKEKELSALMNIKKVQESEAAAKINELEGQLTGLKVELESLRSKERLLESQIESKATEAQQVRDDNLKLQARVLELEVMSQKREDVENNENSPPSKIADVIAQATSLQQEVDSLRVQKGDLEQRMEGMRNEASAQVKVLTDQVNAMQQELQSLRVEKTESQLQLESKTKEISENLIQIETLKEELAMGERRMVEEKEDLMVKIKDLELEADTLLNQRDELDQQVRNKVHETIQLRDEKEELHARIFEMEGLLTARERELSALQKKFEAGEKQEPSRSLISQNINKFNKILDQPRLSKESDETMKKLTKEYNFKLSPQAAERKMEELAADFRKYIEDKIRLLSQRIRVLEQLHAENQASHRLTQETLEQENKALLAKVTIYEAELKKLRDIYEAAQTTMTGLNTVARKLQEGNANLDRVTSIFNELQLAKNWIQGKSDDIRQLEHNVSSLNARLDSKEEQELLLRENIWKLELKETQLEKKVGDLEGKIEEKDEELLFLGEEKREAIRQLCVLIDYHRTEIQQLKDVIAKKNARSKPNKTLT